MVGRNWSSFLSISVLLVCAALSCSKASSTLLKTDEDNDFLECLSSNSFYTKTPVYTPNTAPYSSILESSIQNLRFISPATPKPHFIITPSHESHVQAAVVCSKKHDLQVRVRSGGHDFEGLSYTSTVPFVLIDLFNLRAIHVDVEDNSAWVQAGATLGEVYYRIAEKSLLHGFPAGRMSTIGVGGHLSGAGYGTLLRKYGTAADHMVDARLVNVDGELLNRKTMGEDLFWAIRGGGAASFGVVTAWKIKLVPVPPIVTVSMLDRTYEQGLTQLVHKWQTIATQEAPEDLLIGLDINVGNTNHMNEALGERTIVAKFEVMFLGPSYKLMQLMEEKFPELGMKEKDCMEMSWIKSVIYFSQFQNGSPLDVLLSRISDHTVSYKVKSDFVKKPISKDGLEGMWKMLLKEEKPGLTLVPWGGRANAISEREIAFPHRDGNLYLIGYSTFWKENGSKDTTKKHMNWIREMYNYMTPYVSKSPRAAYFVFRDLDLGQNIINGTSVHSACKSWGHNYFKSNCEKLLKVKSKIDPENFFRDEQTILAIQSPLMKREGELIGVS